VHFKEIEELYCKEEANNFSNKRARPSQELSLNSKKKTHNNIHVKIEKQNL
jgi:hypothetical protein